MLKILHRGQIRIEPFQVNLTIKGSKISKNIVNEIDFDRIYGFLKKTISEYVNKSKSLREEYARALDLAKSMGYPVNIPKRLKEKIFNGEINPRIAVAIMVYVKYKNTDNFYDLTYETLAEKFNISRTKFSKTIRRLRWEQIV